MRFHFYFLVEVLLLLLLLGAAAAAHDISTEAEVLLFLFWWLRCCCSSLIERDVLKNIRLVSAFCLTRIRNQSRSVWLGTYCCPFSQPQVPVYNMSTEAKRGTGYCFFLLLFWPWHRDASDVYCCCSWLLIFMSFRLLTGKIHKGCTPAASATTKGEIYVSDTYTKFSSSFSVWWDIPTSAFFSLSGVLFLRE